MGRLYKQQYVDADGGGEQLKQAVEQVQGSGGERSRTTIGRPSTTSAAHCARIVTVSPGQMRRTHAIAPKTSLRDSRCSGATRSPPRGIRRHTLRRWLPWSGSRWPMTRSRRTCRIAALTHSKCRPPIVSLSRSCSLTGTSAAAGSSSACGTQLTNIVAAVPSAISPSGRRQCSFASPTRNGSQGLYQG